MLRSIVEYAAEHEGYKCGYCGSPDTNYSHGMWTHSLTVSDYQDLIDRGWRRSGKYCYKPTMDVTCCPMYTIRCRVLEFKVTKSQKKTLKKVNKYLSSADPSKPQVERKMSLCSIESEDTEGFNVGVEQFVESTVVPQDINVKEVLKIEQKNFETNVGDEGATDVKMDSTSIENIPKVVKKDSVPDPNKAPCKKAKQLRKERRLEKLKEKGVDVSTLTNNNNKNIEKKLEDFINELPDEFRQNLEIRLVRTSPPSAEYLASAAETHQVYVKYQTTIHNDKPSKCTEPKFRDFLVFSPLLEEHAEGGPPGGYGSFHQQYWLRGALVAVGVVDVLPRGVSSVYFFYDPQHERMNLGTYGALREIELTRRLHEQCPDLKYYYMGYYIQSCRKMRYKGNFAPSDLLCPETYKWFSIKDCIPKLEASPYSRLDGDIDSVDENYPQSKETSYIPCWVKGIIMPYKMYKRKANIKNDEDVEKYSQLVGSKAVRNIILVRP